MIAVCGATMSLDTPGAVVSYVVELLQKNSLRET